MTGQSGCATYEASTAAGAGVSAAAAAAPTGASVVAMIGCAGRGSDEVDPPLPPPTCADAVAPAALLLLGAALAAADAFLPVCAGADCFAAASFIELSLAGSLPAWSFAGGCFAASSRFGCATET